MHLILLDKKLAILVQRKAATNHQGKKATYNLTQLVCLTLLKN